MELITYRMQEGFEVAAIIGDAGRIYTPMVFIDAPVRKFMVANGDVTKFRRVSPEKSTPSLKRAARTMLKAGKKLGITKGATRFLRTAL